MLLTAALCGFAGCRSPAPPPPAPPPPPPPPIVEEVPEPPPLPERKPTPPRPKPAPETIVAEPPPDTTEIAKLEPPPPIPAPQPEAPPKVIGLDQTALRSAIGAPNAQSDSPPAVLWQYVAGDCTLDVYFYRDLQSGAMHALYVDVKGDDQSDNDANSASCVSPSAPPAAITGLIQTRLLLVDDDDDFRESLGLNLIDEGFAVTSLSNGADALAFFEEGGDADVLLLDWRMPGMDGLEVLRQLRRRGVEIPVIFLTALSDDIYEEAALEGGAVDFIDKSRRLSILLKRLNLIVETRRSRQDGAPERHGTFQLGELTLRLDTSRAYWRSQELELTLTEFNILVLLTGHAGEDVPYREIYDLVHGKNFVAGYGAEGYRANVRTFIKRIRKKFRDVDSEFDLIGNYAGFGYRWAVGGLTRANRLRQRARGGACRCSSRRSCWRSSSCSCRSCSTTSSARPTGRNGSSSWTACATRAGSSPVPSTRC